MFVLATTSLNTWGPGPAAEPVGVWTRFFDSIANDPQAVMTILAAFVGFFLAAWSKYLFDRRLDRARRDADRRNLAAALRAELLRLDVECNSRINSLEKILKAEPGKETHGAPWSFAHMVLPPRRVWAAHLGRIGELEGVDSDSLILVYSLFDSYDLTVEISRQQAGGQPPSREAIQAAMKQLKAMRKGIGEAGGSLVKQTKVGPSWWRRILRL